MRKIRSFLSGYCYHTTVRCNNRDFLLTRSHCREVLLYAIEKCKAKYDFKLYGICIMSNHVHYLLQPAVPQEMPKIMHFLNWYSAMCFNRMLNRTGHFWEKRYHAVGFPEDDHRRALNTLRYIHANPKAAGMQRGFFYDFSNYGSYERLTNDGLTEWHPSLAPLVQIKPVGVGGDVGVVCGGGLSELSSTASKRPHPRPLSQQWARGETARAQICRSVPLHPKSGARG